MSRSATTRSKEDPEPWKFETKKYRLINSEYILGSRDVRRARCTLRAGRRRRAAAAACLRRFRDRGSHGFFEWSSPNMSAPGQSQRGRCPHLGWRPLRRGGRVAVAPQRRERGEELLSQCVRRTVANVEHPRVLSLS